jgi:SET and MYND domain-containing protein 4
MQIIMKSSRETHCHFCFSETPADVVFCPSCTIPIYCSKRCQEQSAGHISRDEDTNLGYSTNVANLSITSSCKSPRSKLFAEHRHECGGAHWAAVLPADVVLAGRIIAHSIVKRMPSGKSFAFSGPNLVNTSFIH